MGLFKKYEFVKVKKTKYIDGILIENNLHSKFDEFENIISKIFFVNGIENTTYRGYSCNNNKVEKIIIHISPKAYKENKGEFTSIVNSINNVISNCDIDNNFISVTVSKEPLSTVFPPLNTIEFSDEFMKKHSIDENQNINLIDIKSGMIKICCAKYSEKLNGNSIALNTSNREEFRKSDHVFIQNKSKLEFKKVIVQNVKHILDGFITISEDKREWVEKHGGNQFELVNEITGASMDISVDKIQYTEQNKDIIKLNYFQRLVLECDLPKKISNYRFKKYKTSLEKSEENLKVLNEYYENEKALTGEIIREEKDTYNHKRIIKRALNECGYPSIALYPIARTHTNKDKFINRFIDKILDIIIGSSKCYLTCIRPYATDENSNVVRLSKGTLDLLGIDETDNLIISYRDKKVKARALVIDEIESIKETNIIQSESELNVCIGIPVHIRLQLGINKINVCCNVERDKKYLFKKNLNIQFISILATIFAVKQTFTNNNKLVIMLLLFLIPFSVYIILSEVRNKINNK